MGPFRVVAGVPMGASGSRLARSATAERPEGLGAGVLSAMMFSAERARGSLQTSLGWACAHQCRWARQWADPVGGAAGHPFAQQVVGMMGFAVLRSTGSIR